MTPKAPADGVVAMTPELARALEDLRDIHTHLGVDGRVGPLAVALALTLVAALVGVAWFRRTRTHRQARARLARLRQSCHALPAGPGRDAATIEHLRGLSELMRAAASGGRRTAPMPAGLAGPAFLEWLDARAETADRGAFLGPTGTLLAEGPWMRTLTPSADSERLAELFALCDRWLARNLELRSGARNARGPDIGAGG